ncbi:hypothetical protein [Sulfurisphaera tokodaii]|uniref:Uncharacterized protein n=2 Tax=Sulfurisphaera tokodaii TaxID=111955 RepID=Q96Z38_SULTO|nr:hypothetical protein [Sulfurisphaera tokodaii]BAB67088.1 hypothetical protein STK_19940 [Sulfurisphaera tokodaii str. 7]HII73396.1 hypothetical protein [Sulfurisphaera tokodaii]
MIKFEFILKPITPFTLTLSDVFKESYISSIKGMFRTASIFGLRTLFGEGYSCEDMYNKTCPELTEEERKGLRVFPCPICRTYGMMGLKGCSFFIENFSEVISAKKNFNYRFLFRGPYNKILVSEKPIKVLAVCNYTCSHLIILLGLYYVNLGIIRLGRFKSRGLGIFRVEIEDKELQKLLEDINTLREKLRECLEVT